MKSPKPVVQVIRKGNFLGLSIANTNKIVLHSPTCKKQKHYVISITHSSTHTDACMNTHACRFKVRNELYRTIIAKHGA